MTPTDPVPDIVSHHPNAEFHPVAIRENAGIVDMYVFEIRTRQGSYLFERMLGDWYIVNPGDMDDREQVCGDSLEALFNDIFLPEHPLYDLFVN